MTLYKLLSDVNTKDDILILDTRSKKDFELSHLNYACCINIPDDLLKTRYYSITVNINASKPKFIIVLNELCYRLRIFSAHVALILTIYKKLSENALCVYLHIGGL